MADLTIGYAAMLEQFAPQEVVGYQVLAEEHGFSGCMAADHFQPWVPAQGEASFVWSVLAAVGERTRGDLGPGVTCPSFRFHPAIVAQAAATTGGDVPGPVLAGAGLGRGAQRARRRRGTGPRPASGRCGCWRPSRSSRKLFDASLAGKDVKHDGRFFKLESTRLWTMPEQAPPILVATAGPINAKKTGRFADGIITVGAPLEKIGGLFDKFAEGAREAGKDPDTMPQGAAAAPVVGADRRARPWRTRWTEWPNGGMKFPKADIRSPFDFEQMAKLVRPEDFEGRMVISSDPDVHRAAIQKFVRPRLRPGLPAQRRPQPGRVDRGLRPRGAAQAPPLTREPGRSPRPRGNPDAIIAAGLRG